MSQTFINSNRIMKCKYSLYDPHVNPPPHNHILPLLSQSHSSKLEWERYSGLVRTPLKQTYGLTFSSNTRLETPDIMTGSYLLSIFTLKITETIIHLAEIMLFFILLQGETVTPFIQSSLTPRHSHVRIFS